MWCNSALEELGLRNLCPVVLHFDLLASFTSQVIPPTIVNDKSCLSLHSCKKRLQVINLLQLLRNGSVTVCQAPQINTPKYQLVAPPPPVPNLCLCFWVLSILWLPLRGTKFDPKEQCLSLLSRWPRSYRLLEVRPWATPSHTVHTPERPLSHSTALRGAAWGSGLPMVEGSPS